MPTPTTHRSRSEPGWAGSLLLSCLAHGGLLFLGLWAGLWLEKIPFGGKHPGGAGGTALQATLVSKIPGGSVPMPAPTVNDTRNRLANSIPGLTKTIPHPPPRPRPHAVRLPAPKPPRLNSRRQAAEELRRMQQAEVRRRRHRRAMYGAGGPASFTYSMSGQGVGGGGGMSFGDATFGTLYTAWVNQLRNRLGYYWNQQYRDPSAPVGRPVFIVFTLNRAGQIYDIGFGQRSGIGSLDGMALHAVQQMAASERFPLPAGYAPGTLRVEVSFELQ